MKGHLGAVMTSALAALAVALMVLFAVVVARRPSGTSMANGGPAPWSPRQPKADPARERDVKPREHHLPPPRNRHGIPEFGPRVPRRQAA